MGKKWKNTLIRIYLVKIRIFNDIHNKVRKLKVIFLLSDFFPVHRNLSIFISRLDYAVRRWSFIKHCQRSTGLVYASRQTDRQTHRRTRGFSIYKYMINCMFLTTPLLELNQYLLASLVVSPARSQVGPMPKVPNRHEGRSKKWQQSAVLYSIPCTQVLRLAPPKWGPKFKQVFFAYIMWTLSLGHVNKTWFFCQIYLFDFSDNFFQYVRDLTLFFLSFLFCWSKISVNGTINPYSV